MYLTNANVVFPDRLEKTSVCIEDGLIDRVGSGSGGGQELDLGGDYLIPGLIDLHTDNLEKHFMPREGVDWNPVSAAAIHDGIVIDGAITTVFDSVALGVSVGKMERAEMLRPLLSGLDRAAAAKLLRADHKLHFRCEVTDDNVIRDLEAFIDLPGVALLSVMDHSPGDRQYADLEKYREKRIAWGDSTPDEVDREIEDLLQRSREVAPANRLRVMAFARECGLPVASHDDASQAHIDECIELGITISEFPTTIAAARAASEAGMQVIMGGPNLVRGGSYSGNVAAADVHAAGFLDIIASDYVPRSMLEGAFWLAGENGCGLPEAIATVTRNAAHAVGMTDRGSIIPGLRADLAQVSVAGRIPRVERVWVAGKRVR